MSLYSVYTLCTAQYTRRKGVRNTSILYTALFYMRIWVRSGIGPRRISSFPHDGVSPHTWFGPTSLNNNTPSTIIQTVKRNSRCRCPKRHAINCPTMISRFRTHFIYLFIIYFNYIYRGHWPNRVEYSNARNVRVIKFKMYQKNK